MGFKVKKRGSYYWVFGQVKGFRLDRSLRTTRKKEAVRIAEEIHRKVLERAHGIRIPKRIKFEELMKKYLVYCQENNRLSTSRKKVFNINNLLAFFGDCPLTDITTERVEEYKSARIKRVSKTTINRDLATLKHALRLAVEWGYLSFSPAACVRLFEEPPGRVRYLTREQADALVGACSKWLRPVVLTALHTGMRKGELLALEWNDVDMHRRQIRIPDSKTGDARVVPINELLYNTLTELGSKNGRVFKNRRGEGYSWINSAFKNVLARAGIEDFRFHDLRHTFASWLAMEGVPISTIGRLLGHKTAQMTMRYAHLAPDYLADVVELLTQNQHKGGKEKTDSGVNT